MTMTTADSFAFSSILKLTTAFHYGWVDFADEVKKATSLGEVFDRISAAMYAWEEADLGSPVKHYRYGVGWSPELTYERWSGQLVWGVRDDGATEAVVSRPDGPVISIRIDVDGAASFRFHPERDREPCLIEAGRWLAKALGIEGEYIEAVPPREFHAWRAHCKLPGKHMDNATLTELERAITDAVESTLADLDSVRADILDLESKIAEAIEDGDFKEAAAYAREAARIGEAFGDAYDMLKCIADGADRVAEETLENMRWRG